MEVNPFQLIMRIKIIDIDYPTSGIKISQQQIDNESQNH